MAAVMRHPAGVLAAGLPPPGAALLRARHLPAALTGWLTARQAQQQAKRREIHAAVVAAAHRPPRASRFAGAASPARLQPSPPPPPVAPVSPSVLASREQLLSQLPVMKFKAVGVSFDDRQSLVAQLHPNQGLAFVREPNNPHDPRAVCIRTLDGTTSLGYIARHQTVHFLQNMCFGAVGSVGQQGEQGLWGFNAVVQPTIPPVEVFPVPASLSSHVTLGLHLQGPAWVAVKAAVLAATHGRCTVTGAPLAAVHERWAADDGACVLRLLGFRAEAPEVQKVGGLLALGGRDFEATKALLCRLNCWQDDDVELYVAGARQLERQRSVQPWRLDLRWLQERGVEVPTELRALCV